MKAKVCVHCKMNVPYSDFHKKKSNKDGYDGRCKDCKRKYNNLWYEKNKDHVREYNKSYIRKVRTDPRIRMYKNLMARVSKKKKKKGFVTFRKYKELLGCNKKDLFLHIEKQFDQEMNWNNYAEYWEVDHIEELFKAKNTKKFIELNHFSNLRPLEIKKNRMRNYE